MTDDDGQPVGDLGEPGSRLRDRLERGNELLRCQQVALETERDRYRELYEGAPLASLTLDPCGLILEVNRRVLELLGRERAEVIATPLVSHVPTDEAEALAAHLRDVIVRDGPCTRDLTLVGPAGRRVPVQLRSVSVTTSAGLIAWIQAVIIEPTRPGPEDPSRR